KKAKVVEAGYIIPTERAAGPTPCINHNKAREKGLPVLKLLFTLLSKGVLVPAEDGEGCRFCDYKQACRSKESIKAIKAKIENSENVCLNPLREVKIYE
ncbi:MAG: hypothetical protein ABIH42_01310, partial [Planctomycetota bacterium]